MRIAILSDIHANVVALEAVLRAAGTYDALWNLGDTIGYGPRPNECVALIQHHARLSIAGNHDLASLGKLNLADFNHDARIANLWNGEQLLPEYRAFLEDLPTQMPVDETYRIAHGSPRDPVWEYVLSASQAYDNFLAYFDEQVCFIGHSHVPLVFQMQPNGVVHEPYVPGSGHVLALKPGERYIINPGSVGQPRDQNPRAAYAILDTAAHTVQFHRVEYDIEQTQEQMREAHLPQALIRRLQYGM